MDERITRIDPISRAECRADRRRIREAYGAEVEKIIGHKASEELKLFMMVYDERILEWFANLWDPEIGGFYYSNSARDTEGYLPDIESTVQALNGLQNAGILGPKKTFPEQIQKKLLSFAKSLQDEEDGFFYHPQWGKDVGISRRGRDLNWALDVIRSLGDEPNYPTPLKRAEKKEDSTLPDYLKSTEAFKAYLEGFDLESNSYFVGNLIQSQAIQIKAAGEEFADILFAWYEKHQRPDNGVWQEAVNYHGANGLMKICLAYSAFRRPLPYATKAMEYAVEVAMSDCFIHFCCQFYNPLVTIRMLLENLELAGATKEREEAYAKLIELAPALIRRTKEKVLTCKRDDGSFSYNHNCTAYVSQGAPVALFGEPEGDVNGTCISSTGTIFSLCRALGIPNAPIYGNRDKEEFLKLWTSVKQKEKINPKPRDLYFGNAPDPKHWCSYKG